ncbi:AGAP002065-PA-like protein [Anopheles sinensis]|uniref:AGAP002065-PA-like protein n=1 Tax=Anopheles sinensis TaxID=74873 RepID=A0A084VG08_ANOSI|nr:AGAP002065-PA-like protein [Anopheles sinensis]
MKTANAGSDSIHVGNGVEETAELRTASIATVKQWLLEERPELQIPTESKLILYFLRTTKYNIEKTKQKMSTFLKNREKLTEWFKDRNPRRPEIQELLDIGVFLPLHQKDALNRQVVIIRTSAHDPQKHKQDNVFKVDKMILDLLMYLDETVSIHGVVAIFDMQGVTLGHALQLSPAMIKKSFMSAKMKERVTISRKGSQMENLITLPRELGGSGESYQQLAEHWKETVQANESFFAQMEQNVFHL